MREYDIILLLTDAAIKSATLLAGVWVVVTLLMRRSSAARRHLVWSSVLVLSLAMPILSLTVPRWQIIPRWNVAALRLAPPAPQVAPPPASVSASPAGGEVASTAPTAAQPPAGVGVFGPPVWHRMSWQRWALIGWGGGALAFALPILVGRLLVQRMRRQYRPCQSLASSERCVLISARCRMPMAAGIVHPVIFLPPQMECWDSDRLQAVVAHEAAHLKRHDCLWQILGQLARALYWFNPLLWMAYRHLLSEAEKACDDAVITGTSQASVYAEHLLSIATSGRFDPILASTTIAMARSTSLEGRLLAILDGARSRQRVTLLTGAVVLLVLGGVAIPLAMLRAQQPPAPRPVAAAPTTQAATASANDQITFVLSPRADFNGLKLVSLPDDAKPRFSWTIDGPKPDYLNLIVTRIDRPDIQNIPLMQFFRLIGNANQASWAVAGLPGDIASAEYAQSWPNLTYVREMRTADKLTTGYYLAGVMGCAAGSRQALNGTWMLRGGVVLRVGNPSEPPKPAASTPATQPATTRPAAKADADAITFTLSEQIDFGGLKVFPVAEGAKPKFAWTVQGHAPDYLHIMVTPVKPSDVGKVQIAQLFQITNDPSVNSWSVIGVPGDTTSVQYGQRWPPAKNLAEWHSPETLKTGYYLVMIMGFDGDWTSGDRSPFLHGGAFLRVGNPPEPGGNH